MLAALTVLWGRALFRTLRIECIEADPSTNPYSGDGPAVIYSVWHDVMLFPLFAGRHRRTVALVSKHHDGSFLAASMRRLNIGLVRGSSSRGGAAAVREMLDLPADKNIVMTPDGPRGPRRQIKLGLVFLASHCGRPIVPTAFTAARAWRVKGTWTDLLIPRPFSTVYALTGQPMVIKPNLSRAELLEAQTQVQAAMDALDADAERLARGGVPAAHWRTRRRNRAASPPPVRH
jgi:lysophospholipid acyltransferase (LPLAT)-like uncharacterized protein